MEQVSYTFYLSDIMQPFRDLLKPGNAEKGRIRWDSSLDSAFVQAKQAMIDAKQEGVKIFDPSRPTAVS